MIEFSMKKSRTANYTPADLLREIAADCRLPLVRNGYGTALMLAGICFVYDHWRIDNNNDSTETVTVFLAEVV